MVQGKKRGMQGEKGGVWEGVRVAPFSSPIRCTRVEEGKRGKGKDQGEKEKSHAALALVTADFHLSLSYRKRFGMHGREEPGGRERQPEPGLTDRRCCKPWVLVLAFETRSQKKRGKEGGETRKGHS